MTKLQKLEALRDLHGIRLEKDGLEYEVNESEENEELEQEEKSFLALVMLVTSAVSFTIGLFIGQLIK